LVLNFLAEFFNACRLLQNLKIDLKKKTEYLKKLDSPTKHELLLDRNLIVVQVLTYPHRMDVYLIRMHHLIFPKLEE
jgi:hypothetical protein